MKQMDYKWRALILLWVAFFLQQGTRQIYGPSLSAIVSTTGANAVAAGLVGTAFTLVYGICVPFAGMTADIFSRKMMVVWGVLVFSLGIFASGFIATMGMMAVTYGILNGFGQTFYYPSATSLISQLHRDSRATALSILQLGLYAGIVGCGGLAGWLSGRGPQGWRLSFWILGGVGILWAGVMAFALRNTQPDAAPTRTNDVEVRESNLAKLREAFKAMAGKPSALCVAVGLGMWVYVDVGFKIWMPNHLQETFGVSNGVAGLHAVLWHYLGAAIGIILGSRLGDRFARVRPGIRMELNIAGLVLAVPFIAWMAQASSFTTCCVAMGLFGFFRGVYDSNMMAAFFDVVKPRYHASGVGIMMCIAFVFGSLSPAILGWIKQHFSMTFGFLSLAGIYLIGAAVILIARLFFLARDYEK